MIVGIIAGALMATKAFAKQGAKIFAGGITGGVAGAAAGATIVAPFVNKVMSTPKAHEGANIEVKSGEAVLTKIQQDQLGGGAKVLMAITNQTRAMDKLEQTISKGQAQSTKQRQSMIDATTHGQNKLYRGFIEG